MTTQSRYVRPPDGPAWAVETVQETTFRWEYEDGRAELLALYEKGKR
jgi:hypothetical protein